ILAGQDGGLGGHAVLECIEFGAVPAFGRPGPGTAGRVTSIDRGAVGGGDGHGGGSWAGGRRRRLHTLERGASGARGLGRRRVGGGTLGNLSHEIVSRIGLSVAPIFAAHGRFGPKSLRETWLRPWILPAGLPHGPCRAGRSRRGRVRLRVGGER